MTAPEYHKCARCGAADAETSLTYHDYRSARAIPLKEPRYEHDTDEDCIAALKREIAAKQQEIERLNKECDRAVGEAKFNADVINRLRAAIPRVAQDFAKHILSEDMGADYSADYTDFMQTDAYKRAMGEQPPRDG